MAKNYVEEAQKVLDDLLLEDRMPFPLTAHSIDSIGTDEHVVKFHDSRLRSVDVTCPAGESFSDAFRGAMLLRIARLSPTLARSAKKSA